MRARIVDIRHETWPIAGRFVISRGARTTTDVIVVTVSDGHAMGRGEAVPYARYGETLESALSQLRAIEGDFDRTLIQSVLPPGSARNALDCALWDLEAKLSDRAVHALADLTYPGPVMTAFTLSIAQPEAMASAARLHADKPLLKMKLAGDDLDIARLAAVRKTRPDASLIVDANEALSPDRLPKFVAACELHRVDLIEQPLPAGADDALLGLASSVPICADESAHTARDIDRLMHLYDAVNIKLDKTGGLTEAIAMARTAKQRGMRIMIGCMVSTSLSMAPAFLLTPMADWVDLDAPLLLARDREFGLAYADAIAHPPSRALWG